jgi:HAE1 family hydrophobic/amphiphilic exporter-1
MAELRLSTWGIKNPIPVALLFLTVLMAGLIAYAILPIKQYPNVTFPAIAVVVTESGAAPGEMETQITRPIEDALAGISNVRAVFSRVQDGISVTRVQFELGEDMQKATDEVRQRVDQTRAVLPREIDPPTVTRQEVFSEPVLTYAVSSSSMTPAELAWFVDDYVSRQLQARKGIAQIVRVGGMEREINVIIDPDRMAAQGLTAATLNAALNAFSIDNPGGRVGIGGREQTLRVLGAAQTVEQLRRLTIPTSSGRFVKLSDVATIGDGAGEPRSFAELDGQPVVSFQVYKTTDASEVRVEKEAIAAVAKMQADRPDVHFAEIFSTVSDTRKAFAATLDTLFEGMALASIVVFLFLRDWRSTAIAAIAMPVSLVPTFAVMALLGFSLNVITLLALTLVIGVLVDDAIVEIENIQKRVQAGARPYRASMEGADAIGLAVVATTVTIVVVFMPVSFMGSVAGQFFREFGITVSVAVLFSLLVARLLTPLLAAYFLAPAAKPHPRGDLRPFYRSMLDWVLSHRWATCGIVALIFFGSLGVGSRLSTSFQPPGNPDFMFVGLEGPPGATLRDMHAIADRTTSVIRSTIPETQNIFTQVGSASSDSTGGDVSSGAVTLLLNGKRASTVAQIQDRIRNPLRSVPDARVSLQSGIFGDAAVQIVLISENGYALDKVSEELLRQMQSLPQIADPRPAAPPTSPEIAIRPKPEEAARLGVTVQSIAQVARIASIGDINANVPKMTIGERRIPIRVRLPVATRMDVAAIKALQVPTASGVTVPLSSVADVQFLAGPTTIFRYGRRREVIVQADLAGGAQLGQALGAIYRLPIMRHLPGDVKPVSIGDANLMSDLFTGIVIALFTGIAMVYATLVLLFRSFFKPVVVLSVIPLAVIGVILALAIFNFSISLPSLIGILMLFGLSAKNSILLVEYAIESERSGATQREAIIDACRERARPIIMTTVAMAAGMLPTALALGKGSEFRQPMAIAVIGGLITSTALSLVVVPAIYEIVDDLERWLVPRLVRFVTPRDAPEEAARPAFRPKPAE